MVAALEYFTSSQGENANGGTLFRDLILGYVKDANVRSLTFNCFIF